MLDQNTFTETIRAVQDIIRTSAEPMTREEILSYFRIWIRMHSRKRWC